MSADTDFAKFSKRIIRKYTPEECRQLYFSTAKFMRKNSNAVFAELRLQNADLEMLRQYVGKDKIETDFIQAVRPEEKEMDALIDDVLMDDLFDEELSIATSILGVYLLSDNLDIVKLHEDSPLIEKVRESETSANYVIDLLIEQTGILQTLMGMFYIVNSKASTTDANFIVLVQHMDFPPEMREYYLFKPLNIVLGYVYENGNKASILSDIVGHYIPNSYKDEDAVGSMKHYYYEALEMTESYGLDHAINSFWGHFEDIKNGAGVSQGIQYAIRGILVSMQQIVGWFAALHIKGELIRTVNLFYSGTHIITVSAITRAFQVMRLDITSQMELQAGSKIIAAMGSDFEEGFKK